MKVLLIGPHPPPHGGISVHVSGLRLALLAAGETCRVLDTSRVRPGFRFGYEVLRHAVQGWTLHVHTNGHNVRSWLLALACGLAGQFRGGCLLTLHSGMMPGYLASAYPWKRKLAAFTCWLYGRVICVSPEINDAILSLGTAPERIGVVPAFLSTERGEAARDSTLQSWTARHRPLLSTVLFFRPEYGFDVLVSGLARLRRSYPSVGCVVMGSGEQRADAENLVLKAGLEDHVLLMGDVDHSSCLAVMSACDVFLRTTLEDGDSISVREALALGVPVVASRVGTRPAGVILFHPGDGENLIESVKLALAAERPAQPQALQSMERILELYRRVNGLEPSICPN